MTVTMAFRQTGFKVTLNFLESKNLRPYVLPPVREVLGPELANTTCCYWWQDKGDIFHHKYPSPKSINQPDTKSMYSCLSHPLFNLNHILIGQLMRWYTGVPCGFLILYYKHGNHTVMNKITIIKLNKSTTLQSLHRYIFQPRNSIW